MYRLISVACLLLCLSVRADPGSGFGNPPVSPAPAAPPQSTTVNEFDWAVQGLSGLKWGMSVQQVRKALNLQVTVIGGFEGREDAEATRQIIWADRRLEFHHGLAFNFFQGKLVAVYLDTIKQQSDSELLGAIQKTLGQATTERENPNWKGRREWFWESDSTVVRAGEMTDEKGVLSGVSLFSRGYFDKHVGK
jgi:hypothetical protein